MALTSLPRPVLDVRAIPRAWAQALGLRDEVPIDEVAREAFHIRVSGEMWFEVPLSEAWTAAYRLHRVFDAEDRIRALVISEARVYPREDHPERPPGAWSGHAMPDLNTKVPRRGLTGRLLRQAVRVGRAFTIAYESGERPRIAGPLREYLGDWVDPKQGSRERPAGGRGRPRTPDTDYIAVAAAYADAMKHGDKTPVETAARQLRLDRDRVRDIVHAARRRGLLTRTYAGFAQGGLTPKGRALWAATKRRMPRRKR